MKPALLVIDMQIRFYLLSETIRASYEEAIPNINSAITLFRKRNLPIFAILHQDKSKNLTPDSKDFDMHENINLNNSDIRIIKEYGNAFNKTKLFEEIRANGVDAVILTGFCAENCVLSTYRGALDLDLTPILLKGSLASSNRQHIQFVENISSLISFRPLELLLDAF